MLTLQSLFRELKSKFIWKKSFVEYYSIYLQEQIASRHTNEIYSLSPIPKIAILGMIEKINVMEIEDEKTGERGGEYLAFIHSLIQEITDSASNSNKYNEILKYLRKISSDKDIELNETKTEVVKIYRTFMMQPSSYADAQYEGATLAEKLNIHLIILSISTDRLNSYTAEFGPPASVDVPTIVLHHTQGNRNAHYVVDKVNNASIPHSIPGTGNCLFDAFGQALIELYILQSGYDTYFTRSKRRANQLLRGIEFSLIAREKIISQMKSTIEFNIIAMVENLREWKLPLNDEEINFLFELAKQDRSDIVRLVAAETLCFKYNLSEEPKHFIFNILSNITDNYPTILRFSQTIFRLIDQKIINLNEVHIEIFRNLIKRTSCQETKIEIAKILVLTGNQSDYQVAKSIILGLATNNQEFSNDNDQNLVSAYAIEAIPILKDKTPEIISFLTTARNDIDDHVRVEAQIALDKLGEVEKNLWQIYTDEKGNQYASNHTIFLALKLHPYSCLEVAAFHHLLLGYQNDQRAPNFILFIQKCISSGTIKFPDKNSVAFIQLLNYSLAKYYSVPSLNKEEDFVNRLFSYPEKATPILKIYDLLLSDFISTVPQGVWKFHEKNYTHFQHMNECHECIREISKDKILEDKRSITIGIILHLLIECLYSALHTFLNHQLLLDIEFSEAERKYMESIKQCDKGDENFRKAYLYSDEGIRDGFHVKSTRNAEAITQLGIATIGAIQLKHRLNRYYEVNKFSSENRQEDFSNRLDELIDGNKRYTCAEDAITFLLNLREVINGSEKAIQLLGIAFAGSFFEGEHTAFNDTSTVYLCFTEKFRVVGSIFLEYLAQCVRKVLHLRLSTNIHVRVSGAPSIETRVLCHYTIEKIWYEVIQNTQSINPSITNKMLIMIKSSLENCLRQKTATVEQEHLSAYLGISNLMLSNKLKKLLEALNIHQSIQGLNQENRVLLKKFGEFILNQKIYPCVELILVPEVNSGLIFPVILNPVQETNKLISFKLPFSISINNMKKYKFYIAKPCENFCQYASTAYDIISEIKSHFSELRGFSGDLFPEWKKEENTMAFSHEEFSIIEEIFENLKKTIDEKYEEYTSFCVRNQIVAILEEVLQKVDSIIAEKNRDIDSSFISLDEDILTGLSSSFFQNDFHNNLTINANVDSGSNEDDENDDDSSNSTSDSDFESSPRLKGKFW